MQSTTDHIADINEDDFSFGTASNWSGFDAETMRIHSRARVIQSQQRAQRLQKDRNALIDLATEGQRRIAESIRPEKRRPTLRHLQSVSRFDGQETLAPIDLDATAEELDLRDRSALLDLRREHESVNRLRVKIMGDTQPRSAASDRRWG